MNLFFTIVGILFLSSLVIHIIIRTGLNYFDSRLQDRIDRLGNPIGKTNQEIRAAIGKRPTHLHRINGQKHATYEGGRLSLLLIYSDDDKTCISKSVTMKA